MTAARECGKPLGTAMSGMEGRRVLGMTRVKARELSFVIFVGISQPLVTCHEGMQLAGET